MNNNQNNIVYILTNEAMPGLVKIGRTDTTIEQRMQSLYQTGVPVPFECFHASVVKSATDVEKRLHQAFNKYRVNKNREFFEIAPEDVAVILTMEGIQIEDVTPKEDIFETQDDIVAMDKLERKTKRYNFKLYGISVGETLVFDRDEEKTCQVVDGNNVIYNGEELSLSAAALKALNETGYNWKQAQGPVHWIYKGETLLARKERMESE